VYAQPLIMTNVAFPDGSAHNVVFVCTEHDSLYAFDADTNSGPNGGLLWQDHFIDPANGVNTVPPIVLRLVGPEMGITSTPVIDPKTGTLYVVVYTQEVSGLTASYVYRLHALDIATGRDRAGSPVVIQGWVPGLGDGSANSLVVFNPLYQLNRTALLLNNGVLYFACGSENDAPPYHGWVFAYDAQTLQPRGLFNSTPNALTTIINGHMIVAGGGIWQAGAGLATDTTGSLYLSTGNGTFDADPALGGGINYGDSVLKLNPGSLSVSDYFTPFDESYLDANDKDLGSGGIVVLPDSVGSAAHPHLMAAGGKEGTLYLLDRDNLGRFQAGSDSQIVQSLPAVIGGGLRGIPAYFNGALYYFGRTDVPKMFSLSAGQLSAKPVSQGAVRLNSTTPSVSAYGQTNGIVWMIQFTTPAVLHAYDATNLANELYNSSQAPNGRDIPGSYVKFTTPTIANGKVYVGTQNSLAVYGLLIDAAAPTTGIAATGPQGSNGWYVGPVQVALSATDPDGAADVAGTYYSTDGAATQAYSGTPFALTGDGAYPLSWWSVDQAGNTEPVRRGSLKIDQTPPSLTWGTPAPARSASGWYTAPVSLPYTPADALSGIASSVPGSPLVLNTEGARVTGTVTVTDNAGNRATFTSPAFPIDRTPPTTTASVSGTQGNNGWYISAVGVTLSADDAVSGVSKTYCQLDGRGRFRYTQSFLLGNNGLRKLTFWSLDKAGNTEIARIQTIPMDRDSPRITVAANPSSLSPNAGTVSVAVSGTVTDATSGVDPGSLTYTVTDSYNQVQLGGTFTADANGHYAFTLALDTTLQPLDSKGRSYKVTVHVADRAGHPRTASVSISVNP
jgi:VCBS repeat-containing protein